MLLPPLKKPSYTPTGRCSDVQMIQMLMKRSYQGDNTLSVVGHVYIVGGGSVGVSIGVVTVLVAAGTIVDEPAATVEDKDGNGRGDSVVDWGEAGG